MKFEYRNRSSINGRLLKEQEWPKRITKRYCLRMLHGAFVRIGIVAMNGGYLLTKEVMDSPEYKASHTLREFRNSLNEEIASEMLKRAGGAR
jgi:hypothetical protein